MARRKRCVDQLLLRLERFSIEHALIKLVFASREDDSIEAKTVAVNAMTILNVSQFNFAGMDLSGVRMLAVDLILENSRM